ncbi:MAG TPA: glycosyltransferase family 2 protein [Solirubrobacteraceae bacterium]|nr:glycosyltransferase family 2 protein [Solirubrobacteraceae bacterium]
MSPPLTAIVVSYNSAAVLPGCLDSLTEHLRPEQLLVVDNASADASPAVARAHGAEVISSSVNSGFGAGCNLGARSARNELLLFVNPDVRVTAADDYKVEELAGRRPLGLLAPPVLHGEDDEPDEPTRKRVVPWPRLVMQEALGPVFPREISRRLNAVRGTQRSRNSWLSGALLICARSEFLELGGFDERLFLYYEDQELSRRYARHGLPVSLTDAIAGAHARGASSFERGEPRPVPRAASAISSVELVGILHGRGSARCAWLLFRSLQRLAQVTVALAGRGPLAARGARKRLELDDTRSAMRALLDSSDAHYPLVKSLVHT